MLPFQHQRSSFFISPETHAHRSHFVHTLSLHNIPAPSVTLKTQFLLLQNELRFFFLSLSLIMCSVFFQSFWHFDGALTLSSQLLSFSSSSFCYFYTLLWMRFFSPTFLINTFRNAIVLVAPCAMCFDVNASAWCVLNHKLCYCGIAIVKRSIYRTAKDKNQSERAKRMWLVVNGESAVSSFIGVAFARICFFFTFSFCFSILFFRVWVLVTHISPSQHLTPIWFTWLASRTLQSPSFHSNIKIIALYFSVLSSLINCLFGWNCVSFH